MERWRELWILIRLSSLVMYLVLNLDTFFLVWKLFRVVWYPCNLEGAWSMGTYPICNLRHFDSACKMTSRIFLVVCHIFCRGVLKGSRNSLSCGEKSFKYRPLYLTMFSCNYIKSFTVSGFWQFNLRAVWGTSVSMLVQNAESNSIFNQRRQWSDGIITNGRYLPSDTCRVIKV